MDRRRIASGIDSSSSEKYKLLLRANSILVGTGGPRLTLDPGVNIEAFEELGACDVRMDYV